MVELVEVVVEVTWVHAGESLRRPAACLSVSSHAVPGNDPQLRAVLQEHVACRRTEVVRRYQSARCGCHGGSRTGR